MLQGSCDRPTSAMEDHDLWQQFYDLLEEIPAQHFKVNWIPSHLDLAQCADAMEEWVATWNGVADEGALQANRERGPGFAALQTELLHRHAEQLQRLRTLRQFYAKIAAYEPPETDVIDLTADASLLLPHDEAGDSLSDSLAINWQLQLRTNSERFKLPTDFVVRVFEAICFLEQKPEIQTSVSFFELTLWMIKDHFLPVPVWDTVGNAWNLRDYFGILLRPTCAFTISQVRQAVHHGLELYGLAHFSGKGLNRTEAGISYPVDGLVVHISHVLSARLKELSHDFGGSKGIRKVADLAKPLSR